MNVSDEYYRLSKFMPRGEDSPYSQRFAERWKETSKAHI